jgi:hypothetical protein
VVRLQRDPEWQPSPVRALGRDALVVDDALDGHDALDELRRNGDLKSGALVGLVTFGGGFTWAAALLRF